MRFVPPGGRALASCTHGGRGRGRRREPRSPQHHCRAFWGLPRGMRNHASPSLLVALLPDFLSTLKSSSCLRSKDHPTTTKVPCPETVPANPGSLCPQGLSRSHSQAEEDHKCLTGLSVQPGLVLELKEMSQILPSQFREWGSLTPSVSGAER